MGVGIKRVNVIGTSGSGKSTLAKKMAEILEVPYVEMDRIFWGPNWYWPSDEEFFGKLAQELERERWVLDGNYNRSISVKWHRVELVVWLDLPFILTLVQAVKRAFMRSMSGVELWPNTGNRENFRKSFLSKDSIILWTIKTYRKNKKTYESFMYDPQFTHIKFIRLRSHREAKRFLESLKHEI